MAPSAAQSAAEAVDAKPFAQKVVDRDGRASLDFAYTWPAAVSTIPALRDRLDAEREKTFAEWKGEWEKAKIESPPDCVSCRSRGYQKDWQVVTDLPRYLSLSAPIYSYTGGAHGGTVFDALVWDRQTGKAIAPIDMFRSAAALDAATQGAFCAALDKERARRRGPDAGGLGFFDECIEPVANSTVILGSAGRRAFDRVGFLIPAYNAGPYAEGTYEVTLPVTPAILDAVRPEYRAAFELR